MRPLALTAVLRVETVLCIVAVGGFLALTVSAAEYARFHLRGGARSGGILIVFLTLVLPWLASAIVRSAGGGASTALFVSALSPAFGAGGSAMLMASAWHGVNASPLTLQNVGLSAVVTLALVGWFAVRLQTLKRSLEQRFRLAASRAEAASTYAF